MIAALGLLFHVVARSLTDTLGMSVPLYALVFGVVSGLSLPLGAVLGIWFSPVSDAMCAGMMALGAGALLFAVTVELYGHALRELELGDLGILEMFTIFGGAICGALVYLTINRWIDDRTSREKDPATCDAEKQVEETPWMESCTARERLKHDSMAGLTEETPLTGSSTARDRWKRVPVAGLLLRDNIEGCKSRDKVLMSLAASRSAAEDEKRLDAVKDQQVAMSLFLGILIDGVPEGILMGVLAAEGRLAVTFVFSLFIANFPEAFSSASLSRQAGMWWGTIIGMWLSLCVLTGGLCGLSCWGMLWAYPDFATNTNLPHHVRLPVALVEGLTGGAMIACISAVMLPEALARSGGGHRGSILFSSGFLCPLGFLLAAMLKCLAG